MMDSLLLNTLLFTANSHVITLMASESNPESTKEGNFRIHVDSAPRLGYQAYGVTLFQWDQSTGINIANVCSAVHSLLQEAEGCAVDQ